MHQRRRRVALEPRIAHDRPCDPQQSLCGLDVVIREGEQRPLGENDRRRAVGPGAERDLACVREHELGLALVAGKGMRHAQEEQRVPTPPAAPAPAR